VTAQSAIARLRELRAKATAGEWKAVHVATGRGMDWVVTLGLKPLARIHRLPQRDKASEACEAEEAANAAAIVAAMNSLDALLDVVEAALTARNNLQGHYMNAEDMYVLDGALDALSKDTP